MKNWRTIMGSLGGGLVLLLLCPKTGVGAELGHRVTAYGLGEAWGDETTPGHGAVALRYDLNNLPGYGRAALEFNTDTLTLEYDGYRLSEGLEAGARLKGELGGANILIDYFRDGKNEVERSFGASFVSLAAWLKWQTLRRLYIQTELGVRQWFSARLPDRTSDQLVLPEDSIVIEPRLYLVWWSLASDSVWTEKQRLYPRFKGWALGLNLGANYQLDVAPWGALDPNVFTPVDPRNNPQAFQALFTQFLWAGWEPIKGFRMQWVEEIAWASGVDDLSRRTVGGMTPFTVNVPGVPWAYVHADNYAALQWSMHFALPIDGLEVGPTIASAVVRDFERINSDDYTHLWGVGALVDWRMSQWQLGLRGGYSPALRELAPSQGAWSVLGTLGWGIEL